MSSCLLAADVEGQPAGWLRLLCSLCTSSRSRRSRRGSRSSTHLLQGAVASSASSRRLRRGRRRRGVPRRHATYAVAWGAPLEEEVKLLGASELAAAAASSRQQQQQQRQQSSCSGSRAAAAAATPRAPPPSPGRSRGAGHRAHAPAHHEPDADAAHAAADGCLRRRGSRASGLLGGR